MKRKGVVFLGIDANRQDAVTEIASYARVHGIEFPILKDLNQVIADRVGATRTPEIVVLDKNRAIAIAAGSTTSTASARIRTIKRPRRKRTRAGRRDRRAAGRQAGGQARDRGRRLLDRPRPASPRSTAT